MKRALFEIVALCLTAFFTIATSVETPCQTDAQCYAGEQCHADGYCEPKPGPSPCGDTTCGSGEYCCNESCGVCAPFGASCTMEWCSESELREAEPLMTPGLPVEPLPRTVLLRSP